MFKASAPGSLMLLGEYAVLHDKLALVYAVDKRMRVNLTPRTDTVINIHSALGHYATDLAQLEIVAPFQFVLATLMHFKNRLKYGCDIEIVAEFSDQIGFASSAAVTVALLSALSMWLNVSNAKLDLVSSARSIVRQVQGLGSGADVAACVFGGVIAYRAQPLSVEKLLFDHPLTVVYSGSKTPTAKAVAYVKNYFQQHPKLFKQICQTIDDCTVQSRQAILNQNWEELGMLMNVQQGLLESLGVNTPELNQIIHHLKSQGMKGVKISGSGLGDCVIALGTPSQKMQNMIDVRMSQQGVICEKN